MVYKYRRRPYRRYRRRNQLYHPRKHFWRRRRWHPYRRRRRTTEVLREHRPRKQKWITVRGWEILGICGSTWFFNTQGQLVIKQNIKNTLPVVYLNNLGINNANSIPQGNNCKFKDFCGGYGNATFTLSGLAERARLGMCKFSETFEGYTWIKFIGATFTLVPAPEVDYLFKLVNRAPFGTEEETKAETKWTHPGNLLLQQGTRIVESNKRRHCCKWPRIRYRPPPAYEGWYSIDQFCKFALVKYMWTTVSLNNPMGIPPYKDNTSSEDNGPLTNKWWQDGCKDKNTNLYAPIWIDRENYNREFNSDGGNSWKDWIITDNKKPKHSPFCPPVFTTEYQNTLWIMYKFWFKVGGTTLQNFYPIYPVQEIGPPPKKQNPCPSCIQPGDLEENGLLTDTAYERITGTGELKQELLRKLTRKLRQLQKKRPKTVRFGPKTEYYC
ncbi:MAG: ORF1 protein [Anelloviridae sp.]|uniref:Capsid protein n=1 Tax=Anelloviridae sp. TaxID=2055263 RepID=A0A3G2YSZ5_9VIRU|nr:MAG: ORF1 protein [Anelloviridae sp.]AYP28793.1 MAG: ORF1 protein [Anelloviridae sp.]